MSEKIQTVCRDCIFSEWSFSENPPLIKEQTGCKFDRVKKYEEIGVKVERVTEGKIQFAKIDALCCMARVHNWEHAERPDAHKIARDEAKIQFDCLIMADETGLDDRFKKTLESAKNQSLPYKKILVVVSTEEVQKDIKFIIENIGNYEWEITNVNEDLCYFERLDEGIKKTEHQYYSVFDSGYEIPLDYNEKLDHINNDELRRFLVYEGEQGKRYNGLTVLRKFSMQMGHFGLYGVIEKTENRLKEEIEEGEITEQKAKDLFIRTNK